MKARILLAAVTLALAGCAPQTITIPRDSFQFKGDVAPKVLSSDAFSENLANLSDGETIVVAMANDGSGSLSQPTLAQVDVVETLLAARDENSANYDNCELAKNQCDLDGDGVWDRYCLDFLLQQSCEIGDEKIVSLQSWHVISKDDQRGEEYWETSELIDITEEDRQQVPINLKMLTINRGNKTFTGRLTIYSQLPPQVEFLEINEVTKIEDNTELKAFVGILSGVLLVPFVADLIDNYGTVQADTEFTTEYAEDKRIRVTAKNITLNPGEGIRLGYAVNYKIQN